MHGTPPAWKHWSLSEQHTKGWVNRRMEIVAKAPSVGGLFEVEKRWLVAPEAVQSSDNYDNSLHSGKNGEIFWKTYEYENSAGKITLFQTVKEVSLSGKFELISCLLIRLAVTFCVLCFTLWTTLFFYIILSTLLVSTEWFPCLVKCGVPQGVVLGPLWFYVNVQYCLLGSICALLCEDAGNLLDFIIYGWVTITFFLPWKDNICGIKRSSIQYSENICLTFWSSQLSPAWLLTKPPGRVEAKLM